MLNITGNLCGGQGAVRPLSSVITAPRPSMITSVIGAATETNAHGIESPDQYLCGNLPVDSHTNTGQSVEKFIFNYISNLKLISNGEKLKELF